MFGSRPPQALPALIALAAACTFAPGGSAQLPAPGATPEVRITEISADVLLEIPQGYLIEPGAGVQVTVLKIGTDPNTPTRIASADRPKLTGDKDKAASGGLQTSFSASGFVLGPNDKIRIVLTAPLLSKTRDETATMEATTKDISLKSAELGRMFIEKEPTRSVARPAGAPGAVPGASPATPLQGLSFRLIGKIPEGIKLAERTPLQIRVLDGSTAGGGGDLPELAKSSVPFHRSAELGGIYARVHLPSMTLKPGQKVLVEVKAPLDLGDKKKEDKKKDPKKQGFADGKSSVIIVGRDGAGDLGMVRLSLRD
jgi:hypothetical protein